MYKKALLALVLLGATLFVFKAVELNSDQIWYSNMDHDSTLLIEALRVNSGLPPGFVQHPAMGLYPMLGRSLKISQALGLSEVSTYSELFKLEDPLSALPNLYFSARKIAIFDGLLLCFLSGLLVYLLLQSVSAALVSTLLLLGSAGLLYQSLFIRTEMWSCLFIIGSLCFIALSAKATKGSREVWLLIAAGWAFSWALMTKLTVMPLAGASVLTIMLLDWKKKSNHSLITSPKSKITLLLLCLSSFVLFFFKIYNSYFQLPLPPFAWIFGVSFCALPICGIALRRQLPGISSGLLRGGIFTTAAIASIPLIFKFIPHEFTQREYIFEQLFGLSHFHDKAMTVSLQKEGGMISVAKVFFSEFLFKHFFVLFHLSLLGLCVALFKSSNRLLTLIFLCCGLGLAFVNSLRYFGDHYLLYSELFYVLSIGVYLAHAKPRIALVERVKIPLFLGLLPIFYLSNWNYVKESYPQYNESYRNKVEAVSTGIMAHPDFEKDMLKKYSSRTAIYRKLYCENHLNGKEQDLVWTNIPYLKAFALKHFEKEDPCL